MKNYWDSFDCQVQCEEVYTEEPVIADAQDADCHTFQKEDAPCRTMLPIC